MKMTMGDIETETKRWCKRVKQCNYRLEVVFECEWEEQLRASKEKRNHVSGMGVAGAITGRSALYGGRTEAISLYATGSESRPIKYIDVVRVILFIFCLLSFNL